MPDSRLFPVRFSGDSLHFALMRKEWEKLYLEKLYAEAPDFEDVAIRLRLG